MVSPSFSILFPLGKITVKGIDETHPLSPLHCGFSFSSHHRRSLDGEPPKNQPETRPPLSSLLFFPSLFFSFNNNKLGVVVDDSGQRRCLRSSFFFVFFGIVELHLLFFERPIPPPLLFFSSPVPVSVNGSPISSLAASLFSVYSPPEEDK